MTNGSGVYAITCLSSGKMYIGQAENFNKRLKMHFSLLKRNKHHCVHLQRAFNKYGENNFSWNVVEYCDLSKLDELEQMHIDKHFGSGVLFNTSKHVGNPMKGEKHTQESLEKISKSGRGRIVTPETRRKISDSRKGISPSPEAKVKISAKLSGKKLGEDVRKKMAESQQKRASIQSAILKGRKHTEAARLKIVKAVQDPESRARQSSLMKGRKHTEEARRKITEYARDPKNRANLSVKCRGENAAAAKLTEKDVINIRSNWANGVMSQKEMAKIYGVADSSISNIIAKRTWKHI